MKSLNLYIVKLYLCMVLPGMAALSQKTDSLSQLKLFVDVMSFTSKVPLDMTMRMEYSSNIITQPTDTLSMNGEVYLRAEQSYVRLGEQEQFIDQSIALLVSDSLQRMIVYPDGAAISRRMQGFNGLLKLDSSVKKMAREFSVNVAQGQIELDHRKRVPGTSYPTVSYVLEYDVLSKKPLQIWMIQRGLVEMTEEQYDALKEEQIYGDKLFTIHNQYYVVKEKKLLISYTKLEQAVSERIPVSLNDRIQIGADGHYKAVKQYEEYQVVKAGM